MVGFDREERRRREEKGKVKEKKDNSVERLFGL